MMMMMMMMIDVIDDDDDDDVMIVGYGKGYGRQLLSFAFYPKSIARTLHWTLAPRDRRAKHKNHRQYARAEEIMARTDGRTDGGDNHIMPPLQFGARSNILVGSIGLFSEEERVVRRAQKRKQNERAAVDKLAMSGVFM
ncbi:hypothetical protein DPMN_095202 [Dreissena polymorpha]|uniref:Uncharacterized protein n=1 Tax=Dreissena polymorpha TaxID=45954 RepID=A0A9D4R2M7_DREPO|nr:hypothetical protein DPMN_095202 [Dreissena polymorpha]